MGSDILKEKIKEQHKIYNLLKSGDTDAVCYKSFQNGSWGTDDRNYTNRLRLAYYLLYNPTDDEGAVVYLFKEELKDRQNNSFQGIGSTIRILTHLLRKYNSDHRYDDLFKQAKEANFDCACGYDADTVMDDKFENNSLFDCIFLAQEMEYDDVMGSLVDEWKAGITEWNSSNRSDLIRFNRTLNREEENEALYKDQLAEMMVSGTKRAGDIISRYRDLIQCYLRMENYKKAAQYCREVIDTTDYAQIRKVRLFGDILEACFEVVENDPPANRNLWEWAKQEMRSRFPACHYGNLYTKGIAAAKAINDPYAEELEGEYLKWQSSY